VHANDTFYKEIKTSNENIFEVMIYPKDGDKIIGQYHDWIIHIEDIDGKIVDDARLGISGGMQAHGHGLPSKPLVTNYLGDGNYLIEGMLFNMSGNWTLQFLIQTPTARDIVRFDFDVSF
jgi:hypothetical protein